MSVEESTLAAAQGGDEAAFARLLAPFRRELRAHCYRMAGSLHDADDLLQESLVRVWRGLPGFEGRSGLRTWLYKVTTSACLDALDRRAARAYVEPCPPELYEHEIAISPEALYDRRQSVALAFLTALQLLPAKQRAVVILRDVLGWQAAECAELLGLSSAAVNSAHQRARETLAAHEQRAERAPADRGLLERYLRAWERADTAALVALLHEDATLAMPPLPETIAGAAHIGAAIGEMVFAPAGAGAFRLVSIEANGQPAFAAYQRDPASGAWRAKSIHLLAPRGDRLSAIVAFLEPRLFAAFALPLELPAA